MINRFREYVNSVFYFDNRSLVAYRVMIGLLAIYDGLIKLPYTRWLYSKDAYFLFDPVHHDTTFWFHKFILSLSESDWKLVIIVQILSGVFIVFGKYTKFFLFLWLFALRTTMRRNTFGAHIGDLVFVFHAYAAFFLPLALLESKKFLENRILIKGYRVLPFFCQAVALYFFAAITKLTDPSWQEGIFFVRYVQKELVYEPFQSFAEYYYFLRGLSFALPYLQLVFSLVVLVAVKNTLARYIYIGFWIIFHFIGYELVSDSTMPFYLLFNFLPFIPSHFWDSLAKLKGRALRAKTAQPLKVAALPRQAVIRILSFIFCFCVLSSNVVSVSKTDDVYTREYLNLLAKGFLYQYWSIFGSASNYQRTFDFFVKDSKDGELDPLPKFEFFDTLAAGRFMVTKRSISTDRYLKRWVITSCLHEIEKRGLDNVFSIVVKIYSRVSVDEPPLVPQISLLETREFVCAELPWNDMRYDGSNE